METMDLDRAALGGLRPVISNPSTTMTLTLNKHILSVMTTNNKHTPSEVPQQQTLTWPNRLPLKRRLQSWNARIIPSINQSSRWHGSCAMYICWRFLELRATVHLATLTQAFLNPVRGIGHIKNQRKNLNPDCRQANMSDARIKPEQQDEAESSTGHRQDTGSAVDPSRSLDHDGPADSQRRYEECFTLYHGMLTRRQIEHGETREEALRYVQSNIPQTAELAHVIAVEEATYLQRRRSKSVWQLFALWTSPVEGLNVVSNIHIDTCDNNWRGNNTSLGKKCYKDSRNNNHHKATSAKPTHVWSGLFERKCSQCWLKPRSVVIWWQVQGL